MRVDHALLGCVDLTFPMAQAAAFFELCRRTGTVYTPLPNQTDAEGEQICRVRVYLHLARRLLVAMQNEGIDGHIVARWGLPPWLIQKRLRVGLAVGALLAVALMFFADRVVWDVRLSGWEGMDEAALLAEVAACGLDKGTWIPALDTDGVERRLVLGEGGVAWASVHVRGTVAYVQLRPLLTPASERTETPTNLVATRDGIIESVKLLSGQVVVKQGELVRAGQLLVSGVRDSTATGYVISSAAGEVLARTEHTLTVTLPRSEERKVYGKQKSGEKVLFFFGKTIKFSKNTGIVGVKCDTIKKTKEWVLPGGAVLPIVWETTVLCPYETETVLLDDETLSRQAYALLETRLAKETAGAMLLSRRTTCLLTEDGITLTCEYRCIENIARPQEFEASGE